MLYLRIFFVIFSFSLALSPALRAADPEERKEGPDRCSALPPVLLSQVCGYLSPEEVATNVRLVCSAWKDAQGHWDLLTSDSNEKFCSLLDLCLISGPRRLENVSLLSDRMLDTICSRKNLRELQVICFWEAGKHIERLAELNLERLEMPLCGRDFTGAALSRLTSLKSLHIGGLRTNSLLFKNLAACLKLTDLCISNRCAILDADVEVLATSCPGLRELKLTQDVMIHYKPVKSLTNDGMVYLGALKSLKKLTLGYFPDITDEGIAHLAKIELDELMLSACKRITGSTFSCLERLKILHISACFRVRQVGFESIAQLPELCSLVWEYDPVNEQEFCYLSKSRSLRKLRLAKCKRLTNEILASLVEIKNLQSLIVECPEVTVDAGECLLEHRPELFLQYFILFCILNPLQQAADETPSSGPMSLD